MSKYVSFPFGWASCRVLGTSRNPLKGITEEYPLFSCFVVVQWGMGGTVFLERYLVGE